MKQKLAIRDRLRELRKWTTVQCTERLLQHRKMRILFSQESDRERSLRINFRHSRHQLTFAPLSAENIPAYDLVVPLSVEDVIWLDGMRHLISNNPIPIPQLAAVQLCNDKYLFNRHLIGNGFASLIPKMGPDLEYPYILKKRTDLWGVNCHIIRDDTQALQYKDLIANVDYFCQQLVPGQKEYATHILIVNGSIVHSVNVEYFHKMKYFIKGKDRLKQTQQPTHCPFLDTFTAVLNHIGFEGLCCVNYKLSENRPMILEINPRFGASLTRHFYSFMKYLV